MANCEWGDEVVLRDKRYISRFGHKMDTIFSV